MSSVFSIANLFNPRGCTGEIDVHHHGRAEGEITQNNGHIALEFAVKLELKGAKVAFPRYIDNYLTGYELNMNGNNDFYLTLNFKPAKQVPYIRCLKQSLTEEVNAVSPATTVHIGQQGAPTWISGLDEINRILDHLGKPVTQNKVIMRANDFYAAKGFHAV